MPETNIVHDNVVPWTDALYASFRNAFYEVADFGPKLIGGVVVLVVGYLIARVLDRAVASLSQSIGLETAAERSGLANTMRQVGIKKNVSAILGQITFWLTMLVFVTATFSVLEMTQAKDAMQHVVDYVPNVLLAAVVVVLGLLVAGFLRGVVATSADRIGISYAETLANSCYYIIALMTFVAAFNQLKIEIPLLNEMILIAFGALALGFGLAFGLGGRDVMAGILAGYYTRQRLHAGDRVSVANFEGIVREVGPTATVIETEEDGMVNRHSIPNTRMLNEAVR